MSSQGLASGAGIPHNNTGVEGGLKVSQDRHIIRQLCPHFPLSEGS